jgi:hypothetical protein
MDQDKSSSGLEKPSATIPVEEGKRQEFINRMLEIVQRELGDGKERDEEAWTALRTQARGQAQAEKLIEDLAGLLARGSKEILALGEKGQMVREKMMGAVRVTLEKKLGARD